MSLDVKIHSDGMAEDHVDGILQAWRRERPDLDSSPMGVVGRLARASRRVQLEVDAVLAAEGLSGGSFDVLAALRRAGPPYRLSPGRLLEQLMLSSGAITNRIDRLEQRGLVRRVPDPADRRGVLVELTADGRAAVDVAVERHVANEHRLLAGLTGDEREALATLLKRLLLTLDDADTPVDGEPG